MVNILSIDFDYFIAASAMERDKYFPSGEDEVNLNKLRAIWKERYLQYPELMQIGVVDEFHSLKDFLLLIRIKREKFFSSNTHKSIKGVIDRIPANQNLRIVNIDFHHDYYHYYSGDNYLNCGNWLRRVIEERPMTQVKWIRRKTHNSSV